MCFEICQQFPWWKSSVPCPWITLYLNRESLCLLPFDHPVFYTWITLSVCKDNSSNGSRFVRHLPKCHYRHSGHHRQQPPSQFLGPGKSLSIDQDTSMKSKWQLNVPVMLFVAIVKIKIHLKVSEETHTHVRSGSRTQVHSKWERLLPNPPPLWIPNLHTPLRLNGIPCAQKPVPILQYTTNLLEVTRIALNSGSHPVVCDPFRWRLTTLSRGLHIRYLHH